MYDLLEIRIKNIEDHLGISFDSVWSSIKELKFEKIFNDTESNIVIGT